VVARQKIVVAKRRDDVVVAFVHRCTLAVTTEVLFYGMVAEDTVRLPRLRGKRV
jgi:hypothetical protein